MKKWIYREGPAGHAPRDWADRLQITPLLLEILWKRGFTEENSIEAYLSARLRCLTPPDRWPQIPEAARILADAILAKKKIAVWGDYDVDGITSTAIVLDVLEEHGVRATHHLPDRLREGYGLNIGGIEELASQGCQVLLTVDCGISNHEAIDRANELGMTVIVSDHHVPPPALPKASAIVNPRMNSAGDWPCAHLAGVGVAFYLMAELNIILSRHTGRRYKMEKALDLVALGTLADVMRLEGENRILVRGGLKYLGNPERIGMAALKQVSGFDRAAPLSSTVVVFRLAPRINAAGRMGHPGLALELLRARDFQKATELAQKLDELNSLRKTEEDRIFTQATRQAEELLNRYDYAALVLFGEDWHPGIVGIVASRIVEKFNRPAIVLYQDNETLKGSGRSVDNFDLYEGLAATSGLLSGYGGHRQAAGVRLEKNRLEEFRKAFSDIVYDKLGGLPSIPLLKLDCGLDFAQASNHDFLKELDLMQPFGPGNSEPIFRSPPLTVRRREYFGKTREHLLLELEDPSTGITLTAKAWRRAEEFGENLVNRQIEIAYTPFIDSFRGLPCIDLGMKDWQLAEGSHSAPAIKTT